MKVSELIEHLKTFPPDMDVAFSGEASDADIERLPFYSVWIVRKQKVVEVDNAHISPYEYINAQGGVEDYPNKEIKTIVMLG